MGASKSYALSEQLKAADFRIRPLEDKCAKFQVPSSISYRDMEGIPEKKVGAADLPRYPLPVKFLYVAIVPANACQHTKFQLSGSRA